MLSPRPRGQNSHVHEGPRDGSLHTAPGLSWLIFGNSQEDSGSERPGWGGACTVLPGRHSPDHKQSVSSSGYCSGPGLAPTQEERIGLDADAPQGPACEGLTLRRQVLPHPAWMAKAVPGVSTQAAILTCWARGRGRGGCSLGPASSSSSQKGSCSQLLLLGPNPPCQAHYGL